MPKQSPIRVGVSALGKRFLAGRVNKTMTGFVGEPYDVTSDVLKGIGDYVGIGNQVNVEADGEVKFILAVLPAGVTHKLVPVEPTEGDVS